MDAPAWIEILKTFGFPVIVAAWFMFRLERWLRRVDDRLAELCYYVALAGGLTKEQQQEIQNLLGGNRRRRADKGDERQAG